MPTDQPHGSGTGDPTAQLAIKLASGGDVADTLHLRLQRQGILRELGNMQMRVEYVDAWLSGLPERERWIVEQHAIEGVFWREVCRRYNQQYHETGYSKEGLRHLKRRAMDNIYKMAR